MRGFLGKLFAPAPGTVSLAVHIAVALAASALLLYALHRLLGPRGKRWLTVLVTFVTGLYFGLEYFLPARGKTEGNPLTPWIEPTTVMLTVVGMFTVGLGIYSLCQVHGGSIARRRPGWHNSAAFFISMLAMVVFGFWEHYLHLPQPLPKVLPWPKAVYEVLFNGLYSPLQSATFSLLAFYIASAAYRAFRVRTAEAGLMMAAAFIVMLGQVPVGRWLTNWIPMTSTVAGLRLENLGQWILEWLNSPAQRGITFGIAIGALAMSLRIWLSLERGTFFSEKS